MGVRKVLPLFVSIPFLLLTYYMLQGTTELNGVPWLCFKDVGQPDGLLHGINVLPFAMTGLNLLTVYATPYFTKKDEWQAWAIALIFLVLLYSANTALMLYWCLNQFFNLCRSLYVGQWSGAKALGQRLAKAFSATTYRSIRQDLRAAFLRNEAHLFFALCICAAYGVLATHQSAFGTMAYGALIATLALWRTLRARTPLAKILPLALAALWGLGFALIMLDKYWTNWIADRNLWRTIWTAAHYVIFTIALGRMGPPAPRVPDKISPLQVISFALLPLAFACQYVGANNPVIFCGDTFRLWASLAGICMGLILLMQIGAGKYLPRSDWISGIHILLLVAFAEPLFAQNSGFMSVEYNVFTWLPSLFVAIVCLLHSKESVRQKIFFFLTLIYAGLIGSGFWIAAENSGQVSMASMSMEERKIDNPLANCDLKHTNNIYVLVYDGYPAEPILHALGSHGVYDTLREKGFTVYSNTLSVACATILSMSEFFMPFGNEGTSDSYNCPKRGAIICGNNYVFDFLRAHGYKTYVAIGHFILSRTLSDGAKTAHRCDSFYPSPNTLRPLSSVLFRGVMAGMIQTDAVQFVDFSKITELQPNICHRMVAESEGTPKIIYTHNELPSHLPFSNANRNLRKTGKDRDAWVRTKLPWANDAIEKDINGIKDFENSIVIIMSDHGAALLAEFYENETSMCVPLCLLDHSGVLMAVHWPKDYRPVLPNLMCAQNMLLEVVMYLTGNVSLARFAHACITGGPPNQAITRGIVKDGIIQAGPAKGRNIFEAAMESASVWRSTHH